MKVLIFFFVSTLCDAQIFNSNVRKIDFEVTRANLNGDIKVLYTKFRPDAEQADIKLFKLEENFNNLMIKVNDSKTRHNVVFQTYALQKEDDDEDDKKIFGLASSDRELAVMEKASDLNLTAKLFARYTNGLIFDFIDGDSISETNYGLETIRETAKRLARFHSIKLEGLVSKQPLVELWSKFDKNNFIKEIAFLNEKIASNTFLKQNLPSFSNLFEKYTSLFDLLKKNNAFGNVVVCHNNLNLKSIIIDKLTKLPYLTGFEVSQTNYHNYDFSSFFVHTGGVFGENWNANQVLSDEMKKEFIKTYYEEWNRLKDVRMTNRDFNKLVDEELNRVHAIMLFTQISLIQNSVIIYFANPALMSTDGKMKNYTISLYRDYVQNEQKYLKLIENQENAQSTSSAKSDSMINLISTFLILSGTSLLKMNFKF